MQHEIEPASIHIAPLTSEHAEDISTWRYSSPYDVYDMAGADPAELVDPEAGYHAVMADDRLIGFRSFGPDGRVPGWEYDDSALDTGGGLRPELTGQGLGRAVISAGLAFGRARLAPPAFRVTVASFNARALHTVESLGFERVGSFKASRDGRDFAVLVRAESRSAGSAEHHSREGMRMWGSSSRQRWRLIRVRSGWPPFLPLPARDRLLSTSMCPARCRQV